MSKFSYQNVSLKQPKLNRDPKGEDDVFLAEFEINQKEGGQAKKLIYRSGKAPDWVDEDVENEEDVDLLARKKKLDAKMAKQLERIAIERDDVKRERRRAEAAVVLDDDDDDDELKEELKEELKDEAVDDDVIIKEDPVSIRIKEETKEEQEVSEVSTIDTSTLEIQGEDSDEEKEESEDEDDVSSRRARARERFQKRQAEEKDDKHEIAADQEDDEEGEGDSSEYETDTDDDDYLTSARPLMKPVFVSKKARQTVDERKQIEADKQALEDEKIAREKERKKESRLLVIEQVKRDEEMGESQQVEEGEEELPPDDDDDNDEEFQKWKIRELMRIRRDKEKQEEYDKEAAETEKRREMTDEEIIAANRGKKPKEKITMRYLQKYYHKGSYYQGDEVFDRDFMQPTLEDRTVDRTLLPEVLQVKKFGLKGRTKYTHLVDQDTTQNSANVFGHGALQPGSGYGILPSNGVTRGPQGKRMAGTGSLDTKKKKEKVITPNPSPHPHSPHIILPPEPQI